MKINIKELIDEILLDDLVIKPNIKYEYNKETIEIVFIENSIYMEHFHNEKITHKYLFDHKGCKHLLLVTQQSYESFQTLYSEMVILATLSLFQNRRKDQKRIKSYAAITILIIIILNILVFTFNPFNKVFYVLIISVVISILIFIYASKIIDLTYLKDKERTEELLLEKLPDLLDEQKSDSYVNIKNGTKG